MDDLTKQVAKQIVEDVTKISHLLTSDSPNMQRLVEKYVESMLQEYKQQLFHNELNTAIL